ncbi:plastocyanin [Hamadaea flava]|uniref:Cupredoxin domain-containing protein n=1 Tax=Hamadaea flava TaxID=1742688 RepID=A0ABV8LY43_9ACTN|nr:cupredoxin domain-containing protein [Hamadaea flava]MCP2329259.1 plastocyanin [Hamadaea flava]
MSRRPIGVLVAVLTLASAAGCAVWGTEGGPGGAGAALPTATASVAPSPAVAVKGSDGVQRIEVAIGDDLRLHPDVVRATTGTIEITFRNTGVTPHDISVDTVPGVDGGNVNGGQTKTVTVTVTQPGTYPMPCAYHVTSGMQGTLEVATPS